MPGGTCAPYSANPRCRLLIFNRLAGGSGRHAGIQNVAFIVSTVLLRLVPGPRKHEARRFLQLSGLRGEFLAGDEDFYCGALPECGRTLAMRPSASHGMREPKAHCACVGSRLNVEVMLETLALSGESRWSDAAMQQTQRQPRFASRAHFFRASAIPTRPASRRCRAATAHIAATARGRNSPRIRAVASCEPRYVPGSSGRARKPRKRSSPP